MPKIRIVESGELIEVSQPPVFAGGVWECGNQRFVDADQTDYEPVVDVIPPTIGAIAFVRLFTIDERVKARELRAIDPKIDDFWRQLEDPRADVVVMALPSIQDDIEYTLNAINTAGLTIDVQTRKAEILSGQVF